MSRSKSSNYKVLRNIMSKMRQLSVSSDVSYIIMYAFLYKYCSDILKDHYLMVLEDKEVTLDEAFNDGYTKEIFRQDGFHMFGYFISNSDSFIDEVINSKYSERFFIYEFINAFCKNIEFVEGSNYEKYFKFLFDTVHDEINFNKFEYEGETHLIVKEIIFDISKLDIFEDKFPFSKVFDRVCQSRLIHVDSDPEIITSIFSKIILSNKTQVSDVYNPFLNDASTLIDLDHSYEYGFRHTYAKGHDKMTYYAGMVKFFINFFDLDTVFLEFSSPFESVGINGAEFDIIISRIPARTSKFARLSKEQNRKLAKQTKRKELEGMLSLKFNIDESSFVNDNELNETLENLMDKIDVSAKSEPAFAGEYEILQDSQFLFLINLVESLKDDGMMLVSISQSFLFKNNLEILRKYLILEKNCIDAIISIPDGFLRSKRPEVIIIFRKNRSSDDVVFIDISKDYDTKKNPYSVSSLFRENRILGDETLTKIADAYNTRQKIDKFSNVVKIKDIAKNEFNLSISRYVDTFEGEFVSLDDLKNEKMEIESNISRLSDKIDRMMDDLNLKF